MTYLLKLTLKRHNSHSNVKQIDKRDREKNNGYIDI